MSTLILLSVILYSLWLGGLSTTLYNRIPNKIKIGPNEKPKCNNCGAVIKKIHFVPILGYFLLKGKCYNCKMKISVNYLLIEVFSLIYISMLYYQDSALNNSFFANSLLIVYLNMMFFMYLKHKKFNIESIYMLIVMSLIYAWHNDLEFDIINSFTVFAINYSSLYLLHKMTNSDNEFKHFYLINLLFMPDVMSFLIFFIISILYLFVKITKYSFNNKISTNIINGSVFGILIARIIYIIIAEMHKKIYILLY